MKTFDLEELRYVTDLINSKDAKITEKEKVILAKFLCNELERIHCNSFNGTSCPFAMLLETPYENEEGRVENKCRFLNKSIYFSYDEHFVRAYECPYIKIENNAHQFVKKHNRTTDK